MFALRDKTMKRKDKKTDTISWKVRIAATDFAALETIAEQIEKHEMLLPKPTVTALVQKAIKNYIQVASEYFAGFPDSAQETTDGKPGSECEIGGISPLLVRR